MYLPNKAHKLDTNSELVSVNQYIGKKYSKQCLKSTINRDKILDWFFSFSLEDRKSILSIDNPWLSGLLFKLYSIYQNKKYVTFAFLKETEQDKYSQTKPLNNEIIFYNNLETLENLESVFLPAEYNIYTCSSDDSLSYYTYNTEKHKNEALLINDIRLLIFKNSEIINLHERILNDKSEFLKVCKVISKDSFLTELIGININNNNKVYSFKFPKWFTGNFSLGEFLLASFEQILQVKYLLYQANQSIFCSETLSFESKETLLTNFFISTHVKEYKAKKLNIINYIEKELLNECFKPKIACNSSFSNEICERKKNLFEKEVCVQKLVEHINLIMPKNSKCNNIKYDDYNIERCFSSQSTSDWTDYHKKFTNLFSTLDSSNFIDLLCYSQLHSFKSFDQLLSKEIFEKIEEITANRYVNELIFECEENKNLSKNKKKPKKKKPINNKPDHELTVETKTTEVTNSNTNLNSNLVKNTKDTKENKKQNKQNKPFFYFIKKSNITKEEPIVPTNVEPSINPIEDIIKPIENQIDKDENETQYELINDSNCNNTEILSKIETQEDNKSFSSDCKSLKTISSNTIVNLHSDINDVKQNYSIPTNNYSNLQTSNFNITIHNNKSIKESNINQQNQSSVFNNYLIINKLQQDKGYFNYNKSFNNKSYKQSNYNPYYQYNNKYKSTSYTEQNSHYNNIDNFNTYLSLSYYNPNYLYNSNYNNKQYFTKQSNESSFFNKLHTEILDYTNTLLYNMNSIKKYKTKIINKIECVLKIKYPSSTIDVYGSFAVDLSIESSDIDLSINLNNELTNIQTIYNISNLLRNENGFSSINPIVTASVPIIKLECNPFIILNEMDSKDYKNLLISLNLTNNIDFQVFKADLTFIEFNPIMKKYDQAKKSVEFIQEEKSTNQEITPIILFFKRVLQTYKLNSYFNGGLSSFSLFLLIDSFIKVYKMRSGICNLGTMIYEFLEFYGKLFDYHHFLIDVTKPKYLYLINII